MERSTPVRKPHTSTADLLTWPETPSADSSAAASTPRHVRNFQPSDGIRKVVFGGQITDEEAESLSNRKTCSNNKMKEMTGSGIFESETGEVVATPNTTGVRTYQQAMSGISQISFSSDETVSTRKIFTLSEVAKQHEMCGNLGSESEAKTYKHHSDAKGKELSGNDIFGPPPEIAPRQLKKDLQSNILSFGEDPVLKTAKKIPDQKFAHLSGNNIFMEGDGPKSAEKSLSNLKLREMSGNDIFADGKAESRDYFGGVRKPPGGESSITLV